MVRVRMLPGTMAMILAALVVLAGACMAQDGPVSWWRFDEGSGSLAEDSSGNANDADVWGAKWARGPFGTALHFTGDDTWVSALGVPGIDGSDQLTVSAWVYWEGTSRYPNIVTGGRWSPGGFLIFVSDRACRFRMGRPGAAASDPDSGWTEGGAELVPQIEFGRWYHLAATLDRPTITTYVDGRQVGSATWDYPVGYSGELLIGRWGSIAQCHQGLIDDVRIYARALTADEIAQMYQSTSEGRIAAGGDVAPYEIIPEQEQVGPAMATFGTRDFEMSLNEAGRVTSLIDRRSGRELLARPTPIARARVGDQVIRRLRCSYEDGRLSLNFGNDQARAVIAVRDMGSWLDFEVLEAEGGIDQLVLLQLDIKPMSLSSPMSGHMTDGEVGVCLRALNIDTRVSLGGRPPRMSAIGEAEHGIVGARAGLIAGPEERMISALREMLQAAGCPTTPLGGPWARDAEENLGSYLFANVSEENVDDWIALAKRGGFAVVHFSSWWQSLGHYEPRAKLFPNGMAGLKECVRRVHEAGLKAGMHTLTGCISTNDPWVTPVPDPRLAADAVYTLARPMDETSDAIYTVEPPGRHDTIWSYAGSGNVIRIGEELIHYAAISREEPFGFLQCTRGAFGTTVSAHPEGAQADHLRQRYLAFYPDENSTLVGELADQIARVYNECGFDQIYQDGSEGMGGWHRMAVMRTAIVERLERPPIVEASAWGHWGWNFHSRVGAWDHSKWGFRMSMDAHCAALPYYREASLLQSQLGWWAVNGPGPMWRAEMPEEMEYFCAKVLANESPMSLQGVGQPGSPANRRMSEYLTMTGRYERLRLAHYFDERVLRRVRRPGEDYHLRQAADGEWEFVPRQYVSHTVTGLDDGSERWLVVNPHDDQPPGLRVTALFGVEPYDSERAVVLADAGDVEAFASGGAARDVTHALQAAGETTPLGEPAMAFSATNDGAERSGAWARMTRRFDPHFDMGPCEALGVWVHGDGRGEILNIELTCPPEYSRAQAFNLVPIDFEGWRYVELLLRERNPDLLAQYQWPFSLASHSIVRTPLTRDHVNELNLYLNNVPTGESAEVLIGPIHALPTRALTIEAGALSVGEQQMALPATLTSGSYVEIEPDGAWRLYDVRCDLLERGRLDGPPPTFANGLNAVEFACTAADDLPARAEVTTWTEGEPLRGRRPDAEITWDQLRYEYVDPRIVMALDGRENAWDVICRADGARLGVEMTVQRSGASVAAYDDPAALTLESFDDVSAFADGPENEFAQYVWDAETEGVPSKPGVTQEFAASTETVKVGAASMRFSATSTRDRSDGWAARGRRFAPTLDLSGLRGIGVWVHGDARGQSIKFQLRDVEGRWHDMVQRVDFAGWRYLEFDLAGAQLDLSQIEYLIVFFNGIPAHQTVSCYVDDIRALPRVEMVRNPSLAIGEARVAFPVSLGAGDVLRWDGGATATVRRAAGSGGETVGVEGTLPSLAQGVTPVTLDLEHAGEGFRVEVGLVKDYLSEH